MAKGFQKYSLSDNTNPNKHLMSINTFLFWLFFFCVLIIYYGLCRKSSKWQNITLLIASYVFYGIIDWRMCILLFLCTVVFYFLGPVIYKYKTANNTTASSHFTILGICLAIGLLLYFKYLNFMMDQFSSILNLLGLNTNWNSFNIIMPLGISFYTFKLISYVIEIHRGNLFPSRNIIEFGTFIAYFPTIMSGPIDDPTKFIPQLEHARELDYDTISQACKRILWGMFLKMCIADQLSDYTSAVLGNYVFHNASSITLSIFLYSIQIYADFAGYSEMAIGVSGILGIRVMENFKHPYFAASVTEFWKQWHISLTQWLTKYVYISMGGNRCSKIRQYLNVMVTFLVSGIWHGANWTFIFWGGFHGLLQVIEKLMGLNNYIKNSSQDGRIKYRFLRVILTFLFVSINWLLFQSKSINDFCGTINALLCNGFGPLFTGRIGQLYVYYPAYLGILILFFKEYKDIKDLKIHFLHSNSFWVRVFSVYAIIVYIMLFGALNGASFIYFQF